MVKIQDMREHLWVNPRHTWEDYKKRRKLFDIKLIVVHHTENNINDIKMANELDVNDTKAYPLGLPRLRYHYFINEYADIYLANDLEDITWHSGFADRKSLAVALVGDYDKQTPRRQNLEALEKLLDKLLGDLNLSRKSVVGH